MGTKVYLLSVVPAIEELCARYKSEYFTYIVNPLNLPNVLMRQLQLFSLQVREGKQRVDVIQLISARAWISTQAAWLWTWGT